MKTKEQLFYDWLFGDEEYRKEHNPFTEMISNGTQKWPKVNLPKFN